MTEPTHSPLRVLMIAPRFHPHVGGVETHIGMLSSNLVTRGHAVTVLTAHTDPESPKEETIDGANVVRVPTMLRSAAYTLSPWLAVEVARRSNRYDVVHAHHYHSAAAACAEVGVSAPFIFSPHFHGGGHSWLARLLHVPYRPIGRRVLAAARIVICMSQSEARLLAQHFPETVPRIFVVPNGLRARTPRPDQRRRAGEGRVVLAVGRLERYKQVDLTIAAMAHLSGEFTLVVVGEGHDRRRLAQLASKLRLDQRVTFRGVVSDDDLQDLVVSAEVAVFMSRHEAFGIGFAETILSGCRVVASDIPAHRETAETLGGRVTLVAGRPRASELAAAIESAATAHSPEGGDIRPGAWSWEKVALATEELYRRSMSGVPAETHSPLIPSS